MYHLQIKRDMTSLGFCKRVTRSSSCGCLVTYYSHPEICSQLLKNRYFQLQQGDGCMLGKLPGSILKAGKRLAYVAASQGSVQGPAQGRVTLALSA